MNAMQNLSITIIPDIGNTFIIQVKMQNINYYITIDDYIKIVKNNSRADWGFTQNIDFATRFEYDDLGKMVKKIFSNNSLIIKTCLGIED